MTKKAWQDPVGTIRDVCAGDPAMLYHPSIAAYYTTDVPDDTVNGATFIGGVWVNPPPPAPTPAPPPAPTPAPTPAPARLVYPGPFIDRMGYDGLAILASTNDVCKAVLGRLNNSVYVDLDAEATSNLFDLMIGYGQPTANPNFPSSGPMTGAKKAAILSAPITDNERYP
jgi:hypothetical protein